MPRLHAAWLLFWALVRTIARSFFALRRGTGIAQFRANYAADGLSSLTPDDRERMARFGGCIACGLCDRGEGSRIRASNGQYRGVMGLVLSATRSTPDFGAAALGFAFVPEEALARHERTCPTAVPIRELADFVRRKAGSARISLPAKEPMAGIVGPRADRPGAV